VNEPPKLPEQFRLTKVEAEGATWKKIEAHLKEKRDAYVKNLIGSLPPNETNVLRGQIRELNRILKFGQPPDGAGADK
jgi:hypothetical protein